MTTPDSPYAPKDDDGLKPYVVTMWDMGRTRTVLSYGNNSAHARQKAMGRHHPGRYASNVRRATIADLPPEEPTHAV